MLFAFIYLLALILFCVLNTLMQHILFLLLFLQIHWHFFKQFYAITYFLLGGLQQLFQLYQNYDYLSNFVQLFNVEAWNYCFALLSAVVNKVLEGNRVDELKLIGIGRLVFHNLLIIL